MTLGLAGRIFPTLHEASTARVVLLCHKGAQGMF